MLSGSLAGAYVVGFAAVRSETAFHEIPAVLQFFHQKLSAKTNHKTTAQARCKKIQLSNCNKTISPE
jgi:hypothetical protein